MLLINQGGCYRSGGGGEEGGMWKGYMSWCAHLLRGFMGTWGRGCRGCMGQCLCREVGGNAIDKSGVGYRRAVQWELRKRCMVWVCKPPGGASVHWVHWGKGSRGMQACGWGSV